MSDPSMTPLEVAQRGLPELERASWQALAGELRPESCLVAAFTGTERVVGCSTLAASAAVGLSRQLALKVALVECDLTAPGAASLLGVEARPGLSEYLLGAVGAEALPRSPEGLGSLTVIPAGASRDLRPGEFAHERMETLLHSLKEDHDVVVLDLPPLVHEAPAVSLIRRASVCSLVVRARESTQADVRECQKLIETTGARLLGAFLNRWRPEFSKGIG